MKIICDIPKPSNIEVKKWLREWDILPSYSEQEKAIERLFHGEFEPNNNLQNILIKCSILNDFYSTNIFRVFPVAKHILSLNIDTRLKDGDISLVNEIAHVEISGKTKNFYSFASKYCSHHNKDDYPIYDSYVHKILMYYQKKDGFCHFKSKDLKNYKIFKNVLLKFKEFYSLDCNLKDLDKYLWQIGKNYFSNYNKTIK